MHVQEGVDGTLPGRLGQVFRLGELSTGRREYCNFHALAVDFSTQEATLKGQGRQRRSEHPQLKRLCEAPQTRSGSRCRVPGHFSRGSHARWRARWTRPVVKNLAGRLVVWIVLNALFRMQAGSGQVPELAPWFSVNV